MLLEDYLDATDFLTGGPPNPVAWVDELAAEAAARSLEGFI